jgi:hypothetical protein
LIKETFRGVFLFRKRFSFSAKRFWLDKIFDLYDLTGRIPKETKDLISKIEALSNVNHAKEIHFF